MEYRSFIGGSYVSQAVTAANMRTVNLYEERIEDPGAPVRTALYPTPGVETIVTFSNTGGRAHIFILGREFMVVGTAFVELDEDGAATSHGTVAIDSNPATISSNGDGGDELFITSGGNGYLFVLSTNTFSTIAALAGKATMGDAIDGYFLALDASTGTMYASELLDGSTWTTGTMFAQRIAAPDPWISMRVRGPDIRLMGSQTSEVWYNSGASPFPFAKHPSGLASYGIAASFSVTVCGDSMVWLGSSREGQGFVLRAAGYTPEVVSTYPVQLAIGRYGTVSDAYADSYNEAGHTFYVLSFPTANATWCWDLETRRWHERLTWVPADGAYSRWRPQCHAFAFGEHRWLDSTSGAVYRSSVDLATDAGGLAIRRLRRAPALNNENERIRWGSFELDLERGQGLATGQGSDPQVMMRFSDDGGQTWSAERMASVGKIGEYSKRVRWERLGMSRRRVFEVVMSDPIPWKLTGAYLNPVRDEQRTA